MLISFSIEFQTQSLFPNHVLGDGHVFVSIRQAGNKTLIGCNPCSHQAEFCDGFSEENVTISQNVIHGPCHKSDLL
jgi:hypothetical protein